MCQHTKNFEAIPKVVLVPNFEDFSNILMNQIGIFQDPPSPGLHPGGVGRGPAEALPRDQRRRRRHAGRERRRKVRTVAAPAAVLLMFDLL